jgi:type IX secretion system substrate protein
MLSMLKRFKALKIGLFLVLFSSFMFAQELQIQPEELELTVGDTVQLEAVFVDSSGAENDTTAIWSVDPHQLASVSMWGQLIAKNEGSGVVVATLGELSDTITITVEAKEEDPDVLLPCVEIVQGDVELYVGDTLQYSVVYIDTNKVETDTVGVWNLRPDSLGTLDSTSGLFIADRPGEGMVEVYLGELMAWAYVSVFPAGNLEDPEDPENYCDFVLLPRDTIIAVGDQVQYMVYEKTQSDSMGPQVDTTFTWSLEGMPIGSIDQNGLLDVSATGFAIVKIELGDMSASALVIVQDSTADTTINNITITRDSPNPFGYSVMRELTEGQIWTLGGLPHPMNVLNGGQIYFPIGSLTEDIRIHISLPQFAEIRGDSIGWGHEGVLAGVDFTVMVNDTIQEPYYFETPLIVGLVYKRGLLDKLGIDPYTLGMYFATVDGDSVQFDTTGITATTVDLNFNRIFSGVAHFSSLAVMSETSTTSIDDDIYMPNGFALEQNYPNPFNPRTAISYHLAVDAQVELSIFDLVGRKVETLVSGFRPSGYYTIVWDASALSSGVYFYRMTTPDFVDTKKMILMK